MGPLVLDARAALSRARTEKAPNGAQHWIPSVLLLIVVAWSAGLVVQQLTYDRTATA